METDQLEKIIDKIVELYGEDGVYNPDHQPKLFENQIKMAKWALDTIAEPDNSLVV